MPQQNPLGEHHSTLIEAYDRRVIKIHELSVDETSIARNMKTSKL